MPSLPILPPQPDLQPHPQHGLQGVFMVSVIAAISVAGLHFGRTVLVPVAVAVLLAFALAPLVELLRRIRLGRVPSVILAVLGAMVVIVVLGTFIGGRVATLALQMPHYQANLSQKLDSIRGTASHSGLMQRASSLLKTFNSEILGRGAQSAPKLQSPGSNEQVVKPVPVQITQPEVTPIDVLENIVGPLLEPLATIAIVIVFVVFILLQKEDLRDRVISLAGSRDLQRATAALDDAGARLSRYLLLQTTLNATFGMLISGLLWLIGVPLPGLWGLMAAILRFVPYIGIPIAAALPAALAIAVDPGWSMVVWTLIAFFGLEAVVGQVVEPYLYGRNVGLSAVAVVVAAAFWTLLWGPVGLLLSTPLTMCLVVMGRHVPQLKFLDTLLGDRPPLAAEEIFYLRLLAADPDETAHQAELFLREQPLSVYYDEVAMRALALAQKDMDRGALSEERANQILETIRDLIENLSDREENNAASIEEEPPSGRVVFQEADLAPGWRHGTPVLCVAGRGPLDEAAAAFLVHLLERRGLKARLVASGDALPSTVQNIDPEGVQVICMSYLDPGNYKNARYLVRRMNRQIPGATAIAGFWAAFESDSHYLDSVEASGCDLVVTSLREALECVLSLARSAANPQEKKDDAGFVAA